MAKTGMRIKRWVSYEEAEDMPKCEIYNNRKYLRDFRRFVNRERIMHGGRWHLESEKGCPVYSDGTVICVSAKEWGHLMALSWNQSTYRSRGRPFVGEDFQYEGEQFREDKFLKQPTPRL